MCVCVCVRRILKERRFLAELQQGVRVCVCVRRILKERRFFAELQQGVRVCVCVSGDPRVII